MSQWFYPQLSCLVKQDIEIDYLSLYEQISHMALHKLCIYPFLCFLIEEIQARSEALSGEQWIYILGFPSFKFKYTAELESCCTEAVFPREEPY